MLCDGALECPAFVVRPSERPCTLRRAVKNLLQARRELPGRFRRLPNLNNTLVSTADLGPCAAWSDVNDMIAQIESFPEAA